MKKKLSLILIILIILSSCASEVNINNDTTEKITFDFFMTAGNQYILHKGDLLRYTDLASGDMTKHLFCVKPNCMHDDNICTAFMLRGVRNAFMYNGKLYYFMVHGGDAGVDNGLYQADVDGSNQKLIFRAEEDYYLSDAIFLNGNLLFIYYKMEVNDSGSTGVNNFAYIYDFKNITLFYETGIIYDGGIGFSGIIGEYIYINYRGRDYSVEVPPGKMHEYISDKDSVYWQDYINEVRKMSPEQKNPRKPKYEVIEVEMDFSIAVLGDCYYYISSDEQVVYRINVVTNEKDVVFTARDTILFSLHVFDGRLFVSTMDISGDFQSGNFRFTDNYRVYYYDNSVFNPVSDENEETEFRIMYETEEYFFGYVIVPLNKKDDRLKIIINGEEHDYSFTFNYMYILKTDYYSGNWDGLIEFEW